jgi:hypothetical protein
MLRFSRGQRGRPESLGALVLVRWRPAGFPVQGGQPGAGVRLRAKSDDLVATGCCVVRVSLA